MIVPRFRIVVALELRTGIRTAASQVEHCVRGPGAIGVGGDQKVVAPFAGNLDLIDGLIAEGVAATPFELSIAFAGASTVTGASARAGADTRIEEGRCIADRSELCGSAAGGVAAFEGATAGGEVKVILETGYLSPEQIVRGAACAEAGGATYVKTSTGFGPRGASEEDVNILRAAVGNRLGVKASGGIRELAFVEKLIAAGADLLGTSCGTDLVDGSTSPPL